MYSKKRMILEPLISVFVPLLVIDAIYSFSFTKIIYHIIFG